MEEKKVFAGSDVEAAVAAGLTALGLSREQVEVEVLDEGSRGMFGIGSRPARVRLTPSSPPEPSLSPPAPEPETVSQPAPAPPEEASAGETIARSVLADLLERMGFDADIRVRRAEPAPGEEEGPLVLDVHGRGVDALVGRKGETLASLQRIVRLIVRQQSSDWVNLVVDVEGYKQHREANLRRLAERMAERAVNSGRKVVLEPMPAYERRIVHLALRERTDVHTESEGTGGHRRVTIIPL